MVGYLFLVLYPELLTSLAGRMLHTPGSLPALSSLKKILANLLVGSSARIQIKRSSSPTLIGKGR